MRLPAHNVLVTHLPGSLGAAAAHLAGPHWARPGTVSATWSVLDSAHPCACPHLPPQPGTGPSCLPCWLLGASLLGGDWGLPEEPQCSFLPAVPQGPAGRGGVSNLSIWISSWCDQAGVGIPSGRNANGPRRWVMVNFLRNWTNVSVCHPQGWQGPTAKPQAPVLSWGTRAPPAAVVVVVGSCAPQHGHYRAFVRFPQCSRAHAMGCLPPPHAASPPLNRVQGQGRDWCECPAPFYSAHSQGKQPQPPALVFVAQTSEPGRKGVCTSMWLERD